MTTNTDPRTTATALIERYANTTDATIRCLLTDARNFARQGRYDLAAAMLSDDMIRRQRALG